MNFTDGLKKGFVFLLLEKYFLPRTSTLHHVSDGSGISNGKRPRHATLGTTAGHQLPTKDLTAPPIQQLDTYPLFLATKPVIRYAGAMEPDIKQISPSVYAVIGPDGSTNFSIVKSRDGSAALIDADIRRIDEIQEALQLTGCRKVSYLIDTHEHFDHTSANFYFAQRGVPVIASAGTAGAMRDEGGPDFERMMKPVPELYERFPNLCLTLPDVLFTESTMVTLPGVTLHLTYRAAEGHSHSKGDTTIYFEEEEVLVAGDLLYTEVHPVTFFGNIPNWLIALKPLFDSHYKTLVPGHGPTVEGEQEGRAYFKRMYDYLEDFYGHLQEIKAGRKSTDEVAKHMLCGRYAKFGKTRMVERNMNHFLTGRWF